MKLNTLAIWLLLATIAHGAGYRTDNFTIVAPNAELAKSLGEAAEFYRKAAAEYWFGKAMPQWSKPCPIRAIIARDAAGATSFVFDRGEVHKWSMTIKGSPERLLDSVLPHEVTHTIFASHFRQPIPRWADEGACTTVEHRSEIAKQERNLITYLKTGRGIPFDQMMAMRNYPADVMPLYAQGHSVCQWLVEKHGHKKLMEFIDNGLQDRNWPRAVRDVYGYSTPRAMQDDWNQWVIAGRPILVTASYQGGCQNGYCYPQTYSQPSRPVRPTRPTQPILTPIPAPTTPTTPPVAQPQLTSCDCVAKWEQLDRWQAEATEQITELRLIIEQQKTQIAALTAKVEAQATALSKINVEQPDVPTVDDILAELGRHETPIRVYYPDGRLVGESKTNIFKKDGSIDFTFNPRALLDKAK